MIRSPSRRARLGARSASLTAALLLTLVASGAAAQSADLASSLPAGSRTGEDAVIALGDRLADVAAGHGMGAAGLAELLRTDSTLWIDGQGRLFVVDVPAAPQPGPQFLPAPGSDAHAIETADAFTLHSRPGAQRIIYLDFTGHHSVGNSWGHDIVFPAYNTAGDAASFTTGELEEVITWWLMISEDFAPFDVDVTTADPPAGALSKTNGADPTWGVRCVMSQPTDGFGDGFGGIAFIGSFDDNIDNPVFVFNKGDNTGSMSASHEVGHALGLFHDGLDSQEYHPGQGGGVTSWGPIMGAPFGANLVQWSNGDYTGATSSQNDVNLIATTTNGIVVLADDHGATTGTASPVPPPVACPEPAPGTATGRIERRTDVDAFSFTTTAGTVTLAATPSSPGGNLDLSLTLLDGSGATIATVDDPDQVAANVVTTLAAGTYTVLLDGVGKSSEYSDYGSLGQYSLSVDTPASQTLTDLGGGVAGVFGIAPQLSVSGVPCAGNTISMTLIFAAPAAPAWLVLGATELSVPFKGGVLVPDPTPPGGVIALSTGGLGFMFLSGTWPAGLPPALELYLQFWIQDAAAVQGFAASNGVRLLAP